MNLFEKASNKAVTKKTKSTDSKVRVRPDSVEGEELFDMISQMEDLQKKVKSYKAKLDMVSSEVKSLSIEEFLKLYKDTGKYTGSFMIEAEEDSDIAQVMVVPTDKYLKIDEERAGELSEKYGEDFVETSVSYGFDTKVLNKYSDEISEAIMGADIPQSAKEKLIKSDKSFSVKKGSIEKMLDTDIEIGEVFEDIKPILQLKGAEIIKG